MSEEQPKIINFYGIIVTKTKTLNDDNMDFEDNIIERQYFTDLTLSYSKTKYLKQELHEIINKLSKVDVSDESYVSKHTYMKCDSKRSDKPFKTIQLDPMIILKEGSQLYYDGKYGEITKSYYNLDTDTLSYDTSFVDKTIIKQIDEDVLTQLAHYQKDKMITMYNKWIKKYKDALGDNYSFDTTNSFADVDVKEDKITIKKKNHFWS